jgi:hypothetical protein
MKYSEYECTSLGTRIYRRKVTCRYKKYRPPIPVDFSGISDGLVTSFWQGSDRNLLIKFLKTVQFTEAGTQQNTFLFF